MPCFHINCSITINKITVRTRGEVEDTRLEAKANAKNTKKSEAKAKDSPSEDRPFRGQGQECSRPRPRIQAASVLQKKKKIINNTFQAILKKKVFNLQKGGLQNFFSGGLPNFNFSLRFRGQGLDLRGQDEGVQIVSLRQRTRVERSG